MKSPSIVLADRPLPKIGPFDLSIHISATVILSAEDARRKVNRYIHREVSYLLRAELPSLVIAEHVYWRVPIMLTLPSHGPAGAVGSMDVDVTTGDLMVNSGLILDVRDFGAPSSNIRRLAQLGLSVPVGRLVRHLPSPAPTAYG
jgi:hypothetical protein